MALNPINSVRVSEENLMQREVDRERKVTFTIPRSPARREIGARKKGVKHTHTHTHTHTHHIPEIVPMVFACSQHCPSITVITSKFRSVLMVWNVT